jgi:fumarylacetoacetase
MLYLRNSKVKIHWLSPVLQTHHAKSGCGMGAGDLIGTGTISGSGTNDKGEKTELGCLFEAAQTKTNVLPKGSGKYVDGYLEDGDEVILEGWCEDRNGNVVLGFGECRGRIVPPI